MKLDEKILIRINQLIEKGEAVLKTYISGSGSSDGFVYFGNSKVNSEASYEWGTSCLSLIAKVFGKQSQHFHLFNEISNDLEHYSSAKKALGILKAAKDDYANGYLFNTRSLIEAEIFDDLLEQAEHLLTQGYSTASAVIAGSVLEDALRKLCVKNGITLSAKPKLDSMNSELAKIGIYNLLKQKQITALADLRNKATHSQGGFGKEDVEDMIRNVRRFMEDYFS